MSLTVTDLACNRGGTPIAEGVSFALEAGQALQLFGKNGSGKSTVLQVLAGLVPASHGHILWQGKEGRCVPSAKLVFQGHEPALQGALTVAENLQYWATLYGSHGQKAKELFGDAIDRVGLTPLKDQPVRRLSAGQKRRASLARCLIARRDLWLLDEPTAALDRQGHGLVVTLLEDHFAAGGMAVIATHDQLNIQSFHMQLGAEE